MSNIKELIRQEVERLFEKYQELEYRAERDCDDYDDDDIAFYQGKRKVCHEILSFLDTLPDGPEQPTRGYDEAYLNEKIAKASKSWEGVDVDKFMDEVRGREPVTDCHDLEKVAENSWAVYEYRESPKGLYSTCYVDGFKAGAKWQKKQDEENYAWVKQLPNPNIEKLDGIEITTSDSSAGGKELLYVSNKSYNIGLRDGMAEQKRKMMEGAVEADVNTYGDLTAGKSWAEFVVEMPTNNLDDKVKIIIVKEEEQ